jgi:hypothetical protein
MSLLLQVLLADREVLQDQVVAVELANGALMSQNAALGQELARAQAVATQVRCAVVGGGHVHA